MANLCQALSSMDVAVKYGGHVTCFGHLDVKSASQLPKFSPVDTFTSYFTFNRNFVVRNPNLRFSASWYRTSQTAQLAVAGPLKSELWGDLLNIRNSPMKVGVGKVKQGKVRWNSISSSYGGRFSGEPGPGGDPNTQDILVEMVNLEISKVRMIEIVDESSRNIQNIGLQTQLEYAQLADLTVKRLDASGSQVLSKLDLNANACLHEFDLAAAALEEQSRNFEQFQLLATYSRNDGLFFKNLYKAPPVLAYRSNLSTNLTDEKASVSSSITPEDFTRSYKQILCGGLSLVFLSFAWSSSSAFLSGTYMRAPKLISYGVIMSLLLLQLAYAKVLTGEADTVKEIEDKSD